MKNKKKLIGLVIGLACVVLCVVLLLTTCNGDRSSTDNTDESTQPATEVSAAEAPEASETEPTEEETEPTEEETEPEEEDSTSTGGSATPGGTGGFTGSTGATTGTGDSTDTEGTEDKTEEEIVVDDPGTQSVAYAEYLGEIPDEYTSVLISGGEAIYYNIYNADGVVLTIEDADAYVVYEGVTYGADANGMIRVRLAGAGAEVPASLQIGNTSTGAEIYTMQFAAPLGSEANPEVLESVDSIAVTMDADHAGGYYYSWTAPYDATLTLSVESITPAGLECEIVLSVGDVSVSLADSTDGAVSIEAPAGEEVTIQVIVKPEGSDAEVLISGIAKGKPGSAYNPYEIDAETDTSFETPVIPADGCVYYNVYNAGGMDLILENANAYVMYDSITYGANVNGVITVRISAGEEGNPALVTIGNNGQSETSFRVSFVYPQGGADNPEILEDLGTLRATVSSAYDGYYFSWTSNKTGVLVISTENVSNLTDASADVSYDITISNVTQNSAVKLSTEGWTNGFDYPTVSNLVAKGDEIQIIVSVSGDSTNAEITMSSYICGSGSSMFNMSSNCVKIPVASWFDVHSFTKVGEQILTIENAGDLTLYVGNIAYTANARGVITLTTPKCDTQNPVEMKLVSTSNTVKTYTLTFTYPLGSNENPEQLQLGQTAVNVPAGSDDGYSYVWTADDEGSLTVTVDQACVDIANITLTNQSTYDIYSDPVLNEDGTYSIVADVSDGQTILVNVAAKDTGLPAVSVVLNASFGPAYGSKAAPVWLNAFDNTVTVPAGKTWYFAATDVDDMVATLTGENLTVIYDDRIHTSDSDEVTLTVSGAGEEDPCLIGITNSTAQEASYSIVFTYPLGHKMNPEAVSSVSYLTTTIPAGAKSYYYSWTATSKGVLSVAVSEAGVEEYDVIVNNQTLNSDLAQSTDGWVNGFEYPVVSNMVNKGDTVLIGVTAAKSDEDVSFTISGSISGTKSVQFFMSSNLVKIPVVSGTTVYCYTRVGGQNLTIANAADLTLTLNGTEYTADANGVISLFTPETDSNNPLEMTLVSTSETVKVYTLDFAYPLGNLENAEVIGTGTHAVSIPAGSSDGYYYSWTAAADGVLYVTVADESLINLTLSHQATYDMVSLWEWDAQIGADVAVSPVTMEVSAGDEVCLNVISRNTSYPEVNTSITLSFDAAVAAMLTLEEPEGTPENPEDLKALEKIKVSVTEGSNGYCYSWTAVDNGTLTFAIDGESMPENLRTNVVLINQRTKEVCELWTYENNQYVEHASISMDVCAGDEILIVVSVTVPVDTCVEWEEAVCVAVEVTVCGKFQNAAAPAAVSVVNEVAVAAAEPEVMMTEAEGISVENAEPAEDEIPISETE